MEGKAPGYTLDRDRSRQALACVCLRKKAPAQEGSPEWAGIVESVNSQKSVLMPG
jgi:hypothetical protein